MTMQLEDKLYTSTQVAEVLGVSLRTLYRYMEDNKIQSMRTASGRHRFTKDQIIDFLNAGGPQAFEDEYQNPNNQKQGQMGNKQRMNYPQYGSNVMQTQGYSKQQPVTNWQNDEYNINKYQEQNKPFQNPNYANIQPTYQQGQPQDPYSNMGFDPNVVPQRPMNPHSDMSFGQSPRTDTGFSGQDFSFPGKPKGKEEIEDKFGGIDDFDDDFDDLSDIDLGPDTKNFREDYEQMIKSQPGQQSQYNAPEQRSSGVAGGFNPSQNIKPIDSTFRPSYAPPMQASPSDSYSHQQVRTEENVHEGADLSVDMNIRYYKSQYSDLIELAKKIKDTAVSKDLEYAYTLYAGLSLHFLIKPFTVLHFYANPEDIQIWRDELKLNQVQSAHEANVGVIVNTDIVFVPTKEIGGFKVVEDKILLRDLSNHKEEDLFKQFRQHLTTQR